MAGELVVLAALSRFIARRPDIEGGRCGRMVGLLFHCDGFDGEVEVCGSQAGDW